MATSTLDGATHNTSFTYFVSSNGNDDTALRGYQDKPYSTINAAVDDAKSMYEATVFRQLVRIGKGVYKEKNICRLGVEMYFEEQTIVWYDGNDTIINDNDGAGSYVIKGYGSFYHKDPVKTHQTTGNAIFISKASVVYIEAKEVSDISIIGGAIDQIQSRWQLGKYVKSACEFHIKSVLFFLELNNYDKEVVFRNTVFRSGMQMDYYQFLGNVLFEQCVFVLPEDGYSSLRNVYDYEGSLLFVTSNTNYVHDANWLDTQSYATQQEVVNQVNSDKSIGYHTNSDTKYKAAFLYKETTSSSGHGKVYLNDCEVHIRRAKGVGLEIVQHHDNEGYPPAKLPRGAVFINNLLVRDMSSNGEPGSGIAYVAVKDSTVTQDKEISFVGFQSNCETVTLIPSGNSSVASYVAIPSSYTEIK